jgi:hypothetical protein
MKNDELRIKTNGHARKLGALRLGASLALGIGCLVASLVTTASAQNYSIDWYKIAGGGGTSTGSVYSVSGTIGQHDAGQMSGGNYHLTGGFWALFAVQTPGGPTLSISRSGNAVVVYWETVSGWTLQQNSNLAATASWTTSSGVTTTNGTSSLTIPSPTGRLFFRLQGP